MSAPHTDSSAEASTRVGLKAHIKRALQAHPRWWSMYWRSKQQLRRLWLLRYFVPDIVETYRSMFWHEAHSERATLSSELLFQYHKLEKGLVMPGPRRFFGLEPALATMSLCKRWVRAGHPRTDPIFLGALEALAAYESRLRIEALDGEGRLLPRLQAFLGELSERTPTLETPRQLPATLRLPDAAPGSWFSALAQARRSVRDFLPEPVEAQLLSAAALDAQMSPSACNRQPCHLRIVSADSDKRALLRHQNGNRGFGHLVPHVAILTADARCFFDASERHEPYIDGGLFAMSFILALRDRDIASCCLNWCVPPATDAQVHRMFSIPASERIIMLIAIGRAPAGCMVPRSPRRVSEAVIEFL